jgi:hypothetical protein
MTQELVVHRGGWDATPADLASVPVPESTNSYVPVPYGRLVEEVKLHIPRFGLKLKSERYALARAGDQMFGVLSCTNGHNAEDWCLAIGIRSSYDRSLAVGFVAGSHVFVCDNLAFHGESEFSRKHTLNVFRDLPDMVYNLLNRVSAMQSAIATEIEAMKTTMLDERHAHHLMVLSVRDGVIPASKLPKVLENWDGLGDCLGTDYPEDPRNAWRLYNAFTGVLKSRSPRDQMDSTLRLTRTFRTALSF